VRRHFGAPDFKFTGLVVIFTGQTGFQRARFDFKPVKLDFSALDLISSPLNSVLTGSTSFSRDALAAECPASHSFLSELEGLAAFEGAAPPPDLVGVRHLVHQLLKLLLYVCLEPCSRGRERSVRIGFVTFKHFHLLRVSPRHVSLWEEA
jgi:hypothetical protein